MAPIDKDVFTNESLDVASLPRYEEVQLNPLSPKYLVKLNIGTGISMLIFLAGLVIAYSFLEPYRYLFPFAGILFLLFFFWSFFSNYQLLKRSGYALRERDIIFKRGYLFVRTTIVPFNRVQHVSVERGVIDKLLNISTLKVFTAGGSGSDVSIPGLEPEKATSLKEEISDRIASHV